MLSSDRAELNRNSVSTATSIVLYCIVLYFGHKEDREIIFQFLNAFKQHFLRFGGRFYQLFNGKVGK